jgi:hypothetical protein
MEALAEQVIATYITRGGKVFIVPQYPVPSDSPGSDWSCPDFVALDFENPERLEVVVIEVASASNVTAIISKAKERKVQWFDRLKSKLEADGIIDDRWSMRFLGFVRDENLKKAKAAFVDIDDVAFASIESATFAWDYWKDRIGGGLPR